MHPLDICKRLGSDKIAAICEELNSNQLKTTLRKGGLNTKVPSRVVSQRKRRKLWADRVNKGLDGNNEEVAESLLYEWLLHHRRALLMEYLDSIDVKHQGGETEETFTRTVPPDTLVGKALQIARQHSPAEVAAYVLFLDFHQESDVFSHNESILALLEGQETDADATADPADSE